MRALIALTLSITVISCSAANQRDQREFASMSTSSAVLDSYDSSDAVVQAQESVIIAEGVKSGDVGTIAQDGNGKGSTESPADPIQPSTTGTGKDPVDPGKTPPVPGKEPAEPAKTPAPKYPELSAELKAKLSKCYVQWEKLIWDKDTLVDIREVSIDVDKLKSSNIQLAGSKPEVVFVNISASSKIKKVSLGLENEKALYCVDIKSEKTIDRLDISYACKAKVGILQIEAAKAKKVNIKEVCATP